VEIKRSRRADQKNRFVEPKARSKGNALSGRIGESLQQGKSATEQLSADAGGNKRTGSGRLGQVVDVPVVRIRQEHLRDGLLSESLGLVNGHDVRRNDPDVGRSVRLDLDRLERRVQR
jgi:hypothetical protein